MSLRAPILLRWSSRDLRARWVHVAVISLIIAVGSGVYAGLMSTTVWQRESYDSSYAALNMYDVRIALPASSTVPVGALREVATADDAVVRAEERLIVPTQVDASTPSRTVLVPGRLVGFDLARGEINTFDVRRGRAIRTKGEALLDAHFADHYDLPSSGTISVAGARPLRYVGAALAPEYFMVMTDAGGFMAEANFAVVFAPVGTVQRLSGMTGRVNDLLVELSQGADASAAAARLNAAIGRAIPGLKTTATLQDEDRARRLLYDDIDNHRGFWQLFAVLVLGGAALAAFNLSARMVEAQRREIGTAMALGQPPAKIALRPLLVAAEIALLGVALGIGIGQLVGAGMGSLFRSVEPLPIWRTDFQPRIFAEGAALGLILPFVASSWPVWRAVHVAPIEAIRTGHLAARAKAPRLLRRIRMPGTITTKLPVRNVVRAPRRAILTALGIGSAVTAAVAFVGMIDSIYATIDRGEREIEGAVPRRLNVELDRVHPITSPAVRAVRRSPAVGETEPYLRIAGTLAAGTERIDVMVELRDLSRGLWTPSVVRGRLPRAGEVLIAQKASSDLGLDAGDHARLTHPVLGRDGTISETTTVVTVSGVHPGPLRFSSFMSMSDARLMRMNGMASVIDAMPAEGTTVDQAKRALFRIGSVVSAQPASVAGDVFRDAMEEVLSILRFIQIFLLILVLLIAFNTSSIAFDERRREHATMLAFGLQPRRVMMMSSVEGLLVGLAGTAMGIVAGSIIVRKRIGDIVANMTPDIGILTRVDVSTIVTVLVVGTLAVMIAPLLSFRRVSRMDLPSTLRVME